MNRRSLIKRAGLAGVAATIAAPAVHAQAAVRWRLAHSFPKSLDTIYGTAETFAKLVSDMSGGKFVISIFSPGELVPALATLDAVQNGTVECTHTASNFYAGKDETFAFNGIPFSLNSRQMSAWMFEGNGLKLMREFYRNYGVISFPMGNTGAQMGGWFRKEINSLADLKGLKMRVSGLVSGTVYQRLGIVPQTIAGGDIYPALERGALDAVEFTGPFDDQKLGFYKVAPHYYYPGWHDGSPQLDLFVGLKAYEALPGEYKAMIEAAASHAHVLMQAKYDARNPPALRQLVSQGAKLHRFPQEVVAAGYKEAMAFYDEISAKNANWKKVYDDYASFRTDQNLWFSVAESSLDIFTQSQRR
ncbi:MAG TPA: TRAP transporter substrate-binding protein DctP [Xanthobacteraceae bacterium]|nr:TRAP transporter substrate-binding protein DctP [Xanthobacteraceae bacterium]